MGNKLELTWVGKYDEINLEPRILVENKIKSYGDAESENMLIHGDNLLALKSLESEYTNKIKCIYIDPPYNTGSAFELYDDNLEHSIWLNLMKIRLELLKKLLSEDGVIYIQIDDIEYAYLKIICDEIFGRQNFVTTIAVKMSTPSGVKLSHRDKKILKIKEFILVYAKDRNNLKFNPQYKPKTEWDNYYEWYVDKNGEDSEKWKVYPLKEILKKNGIDEMDINDKKFKEFYLKNADKIWQRGRNTNIPEEVLKKSQSNWETVFEYTNGDDGEKQYCYKGRRMAFLSKVVKECIDNNGKKVNDIGTLICDFWEDISTAALFSEGKVSFPNGKKPETLIQRVLELSSNEGDLVLDSFLGSGTTIAVANKMNRKWIGIEMGEHCYTHCIPRINSVIDGTDKTGISKAIDWKGGGGYKFYELAPTLINTDSFGEAIINKEYNADMLASAVALHEGFKYNPSKEKFWKQSEGNEKSYLYVTTKFFNKEDIENIKTDMEDNEFLIIACTAYDKDIEGLYKNIKIKKIPEMLLAKCEFGKENYNLNIINPPEYEEEIEDDE